MCTSPFVDTFLGYMERSKGKLTWKKLPTIFIGVLCISVPAVGEETRVNVGCLLLDSRAVSTPPPPTSIWGSNAWRLLFCVLCLPFC